MCDVEMQNWSIPSLKLHSYSRVPNICVTLLLFSRSFFLQHTHTYSEQIFLVLVLNGITLLLVFPKFLPPILLFWFILHVFGTLEYFFASSLSIILNAKAWPWIVCCFCVQNFKIQSIYKKLSLYSRLRNTGIPCLKKLGVFSKLLWPSQNIWTLIRKTKNLWLWK